MKTKMDRIYLGDPARLDARNQTKKEIAERQIEYWREPARRFENNDYPCPQCGKQLPQYGEGIHICDIGGNILPDRREANEDRYGK